VIDLPDGRANQCDGRVLASLARPLTRQNPAVQEFEIRKPVQWQKALSVNSVK
jgi:hypothetical protein